MDTEQDKKEQVKAEKGSDKGPSKEPKQDDSPKSASKQDGKADGKADAKKSSIKTQEKDLKPDRKSADFHPDYHEIEVTMTDGKTFKTRSTWGKKGDNLRLEVDPKTHPAWTGGKAQIIDTEGRVERFNRRFKGLGTSKTLAKSQDKEKETDNKQSPPSPDSKK